MELVVSGRKRCGGGGKSELCGIRWAVAGHIIELVVRVAFNAGLIGSLSPITQILPLCHRSSLKACQPRTAVAPPRHRYKCVSFWSSMANSRGVKGTLTCIPHNFKRTRNSQARTHGEHRHPSFCAINSWNSRTVTGGIVRGSFL